MVVPPHGHNVFPPLVLTVRNRSSSVLTTAAVRYLRRVSRGSNNCNVVDVVAQSSSQSSQQAGRRSTTDRYFHQPYRPLAAVSRFHSSSYLIDSSMVLRVQLQQQQQQQQQLQYHLHHHRPPPPPILTQAIIRCFTTKNASPGNDNNRKDRQEESVDDNSAHTNVTTPNVAATTTSAAVVVDPPMVSWVDRYVTTRLRPYAELSRMDKPIGTWLLLWPCCWSTAMAAGTTSGAAATSAAPTASALALALPIESSIVLMAQFTAGAFIMRGAGCTINDLWDQDVDRQVSRTTSRPLASGQVTTAQAVVWLGIQLSAGLGVLLSLPHTYYCFLWGASSLPLVVMYPLMKRFFPYPQLVLGLTFNWGAWMGWAAGTGSMDYNVIGPLYVSGVAWTMVYDTIYANQDKDDDAKLGLQSTALTFSGHRDDDDKSDDGDRIAGATERMDKRQRTILHSFAALAYGSWLLSGYNLSTGYVDPETFSFVPYALGVTTAYGHLLWQIQTAQLTPPPSPPPPPPPLSSEVNGDNNEITSEPPPPPPPPPETMVVDPHNLGDRFRSNATVGGIVFGSIVAGKALPLMGM